MTTTCPKDGRPCDKVPCPLSCNPDVQRLNESIKAENDRLILKEIRALLGYSRIGRDNV